MKLEELKEAWKNQDTRTTVQTILLLESIRRKQRRHKRYIWLRNIREGWLTIVAGIFFTFSVESDVVSKAQLWPFYLTMAILFGIGAFRVWDNRRQKHKILEYKDSTLSFIERSLMNINHRIWLLENIFWWWILPMIVGGILVIIQIIMIVGFQDPTALFRKLGWGVGITCVILGGVYWGNLWSTRKYWQPRKVELEAIADSLKTN